MEDHLCQGLSGGMSLESCIEGYYRPCFSALFGLYYSKSFVFVPELVL